MSETRPDAGLRDAARGPIGAILPVREEEFSAALVIEEGKTTAVLSGCADIPVKAPLDRFLRQVHDDACRRGLQEVAADLRALEFMDSSCLKTLVWWVLTVNESSCPLYRIVFVSNPQHMWQSRSLNALAALVGEDAITVVAPA